MRGFPFRGRLQALRPRVLIPVVDLLVLAYLWAIGTCFVSLILYGEEAYLLLPWEWMALGVALGAAVWESFGDSLGMRMLGRRLLGADGTPPKFSGFLRFLVLWPLSLLPFIPLLDREGRTLAEIGSGLRLSLPPPGRRPWYRTGWGWAILLIAVFTLGAAFGITQVSFQTLVTGAPKTAKFWQAFASPDTSLLGLGIRLLIETFFMAMMATVLAVLVAAPLSFLAARNLMQGPPGRLVYAIVRVAMSLTRSVDAVIWAIIFSVWVGMGSFAGALALWVHSIADLVKLYSEQLEHIDPGPLEAITATGAGRLAVIRYGVIPQIINPYLSFTLYRWDINVRMATVVGVVGGGGIGWRLSAHLRSWQFPQASMLTLLIIALVWAIDYTSSRLRAKLA